MLIGAAVAFGVGIYATLGADKAAEYFAGYLLEQSLSVDNLFVFVLIFDYFKVDQEGQDKVSATLVGAIHSLCWGKSTVFLISAFRPDVPFRRQKCSAMVSAGRLSAMQTLHVICVKVPGKAAVLSKECCRS